MVAPLLVWALVSTPGQATGGLPVPPFSRALGRPLAWDRYGIYALDVKGPLPKADTAILDQVAQGELGRAEALARKQMARDGDDPLPAWVLGQIFRVKRSALAEYRREVEGRIDKPASPAILFYRLHVCRVTKDETLVLPGGVCPGQDVSRRPEFMLRQRLQHELETLRDLCKPYASKSLGLAIGIAQVAPSWAISNRAVLEGYRAAHSRGVDIRPLICQAYNTGQGYGLSTFPDGHKERLSWPDEPQPKKALEVALSILEDRPNDPLGHFNAGRSYARMKQTRTARQQMQAALGAGGLPPAYEMAARRYVETGAESAFQVDVPY